MTSITAQPRRKELNQPGNPGQWASTPRRAPEVGLPLEAREDLPFNVYVDRGTQLVALSEYGPHHVTVLSHGDGEYQVFSDKVVASFDLPEGSTEKEVLFAAARAFDEQLAEQMVSHLGEIPALDDELQTHIDQVRSRREPLLPYGPAKQKEKLF